MPAFRWKPLAEYSAFGQLIASFMWEQRPPLNPTQLAELTGIEYLSIYRWFNGNARPDPSHLVVLARHTPLTVQQLFMAAEYTTNAFPLFSEHEAWEHIRERVMLSPHIGLAEHELVLRILRQVQEEDPVNDSPATAAVPLPAGADDAEEAHSVDMVQEP